MKSLNKKGSHVSLVLSFTFFALALVFVYIIMSSAVVTPSTKTNSLEVVKSNVLEEISNDIWVIRAYNGSLSGDCMTLNNPDSSIVGGIAIALDSSNSPMGTKVSGSDILVESENGFFKIYYSEFFEKTEGSYSGCSPLTAKSVIKERKFLEMKIENLIDRYNTDYSSLKEDLAVPLEMEFDLVFEYSNGVTIGASKRNPQVEIYSDELKINYLTKSGFVGEGTLWVRVW